MITFCWMKMFKSLINQLSNFRWKLITSSAKYPNTDLHSCFLNLKNRGFEPKSVLDIGANQGRWSEPCRKVFPDAEFTLIEPQMEMRPRLDAFCKRSGKANWLQLGVSDSPGKLPFIVFEDQVSSTFDFDPAINERNNEVREIEVTTIDSLIESKTCPVPDILKVDAEGFEAKILASATKLLGVTELIFLEAQLFNDESDCSFVKLVNLMDEVGYAVYDFSWFGRRVQDKAVALSEIVFARKDGFLRGNQAIQFATDYSRVKKRVA